VVIGFSRVARFVSSRFFLSKELARSRLCRALVLRELGFLAIQSMSGAAHSESTLSFLRAWKLVGGGALVFELGLGAGSES
jgi:hypothetical protein